MVKSAPTMIERLQKEADYQKLKEWTSMVEDWVEGYTQVSPKSLGPNAVRLLARMTMSSGLYSMLEQVGGLGDRIGEGTPADWERMMEHLR